ncbi:MULTISPECIES: LysM peptidoglycan-binding domain-containing protein [unclassified Microbacterium]|uniref:LysM peptidoglycan-binding domain-containing protein n=1 Tax=unclassified Microbacterium TaxID=2609290 RepID=UPI0018CC6D82|nr:MULTISPECIES: LysM peptidoglycan-binding domain-containing protein [unclassified Microbacterium]MCV0335226.1 LysM peptidoglycan-binding domain-containing protein [Microbacterium sp.]MCV0375329.1 LysM peptidoglycan-binding domain-containing protein [Microbacterium sp.]MCV0388152.1 LysM peptidoglycan-binding domain-containing protein [Microbacterium sp.]MCV0416679.1 LysM peptidoglycan-binding domain-containing protein [Microbacterium sp.]MCV0423292.1 LysM peptidoglycan-binding domain-containi
MTVKTATRRTRYLPIGVPAAVLGALATTLTAAPAHAASPSDAAAVERPRLLPARAVPTEAAPPSYVVRPGDTVSAIATRFGLRAVDVLTWNGLSWRSVIYPGQTLTLLPAAPAATPAATPTAAPAPPASATHQVVAGDTVYAIAQRYGTTVDAVLSANGLTRASIILPGQSLVVAGTAAPAAAPTPAAVPAVAPASAATHTVVAGDTLFGIAQKYGTTTQTLYAANGLGPSSIIYPGQTLSLQATPVAAPAPTTASASAGGQQTATLTAEQAANAALIIRVGRELGVSDRAIAIALATGMVESGLRNLDWGDRDSLGIFQQRPSTGWGTPAQIMDAERSTRVFYGGQADPNGQVTRGLLDIPGWEGMPFTEAAQAVQISAYPDKYGQWETQAYAWLALHG